MFGLKQRHTYDQLINIVKDGGEIKLELPNRDATIIRNSQKYQSLLHEHLNDLEEQQNKVAKHNILQNEIKQQKGVGNHQINVKTFDMTKDDDDGKYDTAGESNGNGNGNYLTPEPHSESDITETISSVTDEEERKKQDQLKAVTAKKYISHSMEGKMLEERAEMSKEVTEGSTKKGAYDTKMKEMMRAYNNNELGDNKEFIEDLVELHHRIKSFGQGGRFGRYDFEEDKKEEKKRINEGIEDLWEKYSEFKSVMSVLMPNYQTLHNIALESVLKGKDMASAVQGAKDAGIIFQTPSSSSKDTLRPTAPKPKGRPKKDPQPDAEPKPAPKPKGRPKKQT